MQTHAENARVFMALADTTRLRVLELLQSGEKTASAIQATIGAGQSTVSHHMKILLESGIVAGRKAGKWIHYSISESGSRSAARALRALTNTSAVPDEPSETILIKGQRSAIGMPFTIVVDSSCDCTAEYLAQHAIDMLPIPFTVDDKEQKLAGKSFYDALRNGSVAKTSMLNPDVFTKAFTEYAQKDQAVVYIALSSGLSGTYQSAELGLAEVKETYPECQIHLVDSLSATTLNTLLLYHAVQKRDSGASAAETAAFLNERKHHAIGVFTVDDLMYLHRGGRLGKLSAVGGSLLGIKPVLGMLPNGKLELKEKTRGRIQALKLMVSSMAKRLKPDAALDTVFVTHTDSQADAEKVAELVKAAVNVRNVEIVMMGPVIGAHVGPGTIALVFESHMTREECEQKFYGGK